MSNSQNFERFGKYLILDHLVDGGMAKICRARFLGDQANKIVAIKMIQPQHSQDAAYRKMFEDELRVCFSLNHPNIAQTYDYGLVNNQLFTAMEYVDGRNLKQVLDRLKKIKKVFPVEISVYIISQVCQGLHYAHTYIDPLSGKRANIVHRDISPHNIMITYDGAVKIIDFGIAKADSNSEKTQVGTLKGKVSYIAPEYIEGLELDHRYDQFAVGLTLWELLCSRKLFQAKNELAILKEIQTCNIPAPSSINPLVPKELDEIVLKAISKNRNQRFEDMEQFSRALVKFLYQTYPNFNSTDLSYFARELFKRDIEADRQRFIEYGKIDLTPFISDFQNTPHHPIRKNLNKESGAEIHFEITEDDLKKTQLKIEMEDPSKTRSKVNLPSQVNQIFGYEKDSKFRRINSNKEQRTQTNLERFRQKRVSAPGKSRGKFFLMVASIAALGFIFKDNLLLIINPEPNTRTIAATDTGKLDPQTQRPQGKIYFRQFDPLSDLFINDKKITFSPSGIDVDLNQDIFIVVEKDGHLPYKEKLVLTDINQSIELTIPELKKAKFGLLSTSQNFPKGSKLIFTLEGEIQEKELPLQDYRIPAGQYQASIIDPVLGIEKKIEFVIEENKKFFLQ